MTLIHNSLLNYSKYIDYQEGIPNCCIIYNCITTPIFADRWHSDDISAVVVSELATNFESSDSVLNLTIL